MNEILKYFPEKISKKIAEDVKDRFDELEEIRLRVGKPIILKYHDVESVIFYYLSIQEIIDCLQRICENSIYSYQNQIAEGFVTISGGHRVGISGSCVVENGKVKNISNICSLNFRIANQRVGCSDAILDYILNIKDHSVYNTLIVSAPGSGKTTLLRDIARQVSSGVRRYNFSALNVGIVDERGEIASLYKGVPQNDVGLMADVMENVSKDVGMKMLIRSMAPKVLIADEIGSMDDIFAIHYAVCSGSKGIFTAHGASLEEILANPILNSFVNMNLIERIIILDEVKKGKIKNVYFVNKSKNEYEEIVL